MTYRRPHNNAAQLGAAFVEFAIALPVMLFAVAAVFDVVSLLRYKNIAIDASRFAGRMAGVHATSSEIGTDACLYINTQMPAATAAEIKEWSAKISQVTVCEGGFQFKQLRVIVERKSTFGFHPFGYLAGVKAVGESYFPDETDVRPAGDWWLCKGASEVAKASVDCVKPASST